MLKKILGIAFAILVLYGCSGSSENDGLSSQEKQFAVRLDEIAKRTGGDWQKLTEDEKSFLVNELSRGSEQSAKKLLEGKAGKLRASPGGK